MTLVLTVKKERHQSDYFLVGFLLAHAAIPLHLLVNYGEGFRFIALDFSPNLYRIFESAYWLEGPLLLWYTRSLCYKNYRPKRSDISFLIPVFAFVIYNFFTFYLLDKQTKIDFLYDYKTIDATLPHHLAGLLRELFRVLCSVLCLLEIRRYRRRMHDQFSNIEKIDLGWLKFLVIVFFIIQLWAITVSLAIIFSAHLQFQLNFNFMGLTGNYTTFVLISVLIFFSLSRTNLLEGVEHKHDETQGRANRTEATIDPTTIKKIEHHMDIEMPYLANILTLEQLASQLELPTRVLSTTINRHFKKNFFEFINRYRVEEAKLQLANPELRSKTMIDIMRDCGFNSKATFNTFFKKIEHITPSEYRQRALKQ